MKKMHVFAVSAALLFSASALAADLPTEPKVPETKVCAEIGQMLKYNNIVLDNQEDVSAWVRFTVNSKNEIVVLTVRTDDQQIERFVKAKLNYQDIQSSGLEVGETYEIPIRFTS